MKEGISKHMALLGVELYEISSKFIYTLRNAQHRPDTAFEYLPEYTINTNAEANNKLIPAKYFHQFVGFSEDEDDNKYLYFNLSTLDKLLAEEISQAGVDDLFENVDFKKILSNFKPQPEEDIKNFSFPWCYYLVIELTYISSYDHEGGYDCDMQVDIIGYLDNNMNIKYFEKEQ